MIEQVRPLIHSIPTYKHPRVYRQALVGAMPHNVRVTTIRSYAPGDESALVELFARAGDDSPTGSLWGEPASERAVYLDPYVEHCPESRERRAD